MLGVGDDGPQHLAAHPTSMAMGWVPRLLAP